MPAKDKTKKKSDEVSYATKLRLAFKSGNRCAICKTELVYEENGTTKSIGDAHHIRPKKDENDPRYDRFYPEDKLHSEENLIYLCRDKCHKEVHRHPEIYTVDTQQTIKKAHEQKYANMSATISKYEEKEEEFEEFALLPMFREFDRRRRIWLNDRLTGVFNEFNPINYKGKLDSVFPKTGLRISVWKKDYGMMPDGYYQINPIQDYEKVGGIETKPLEGYPPFGSDSYAVRNVLDTEFSKIILDLTMLEDSEDESCFVYEDFLEILEKIAHFEKPMLLLDANANMVDWNFKKRNLSKEIFFSRNVVEGDYCKAATKINEFELSVIKYYIPPNLMKTYPKFSQVKGIFIDQDKVEYRIKEPLRVEWRIKNEPVKVVEHMDGSSKKILDKDYFDFRCFTLAEIKNYSTTIIWKYTKDELETIKKHQKRLEKLPQKKNEKE